MVDSLACGNAVCGHFVAGIANSAYLLPYSTVESLHNNPEREHLAHEIHDTMAQSFAGIGYQIQGIRSSVVRGDHLDLHQIADQLSVAYQLVRSCHSEASRTIAILGSASSPLQQNLLGALEDATRRIAGDQIATSAELRGTPIPLNLRLADALLHIGQQAVANAVSHGNPSVLRITLSYEGRDVELTVEDNGQGFEYTPDTAGSVFKGCKKELATWPAPCRSSAVPEMARR